MHDSADAVTNVLLDHAVAQILGITLHARGDLGPPAAPGQFLHRDAENMLPRLDEPTALGTGVADQHTDGGVGAPTIEFARGIDLEDVAVADFSVAGNAVHYLLIKREARAGRKRNLGIAAGVVFEKRRRPILRVQRLDRPIDLDGARARLGHLATQSQRLSNDLA